MTAPEERPAQAEASAGEVLVPRQALEALAMGSVARSGRLRICSMCGRGRGWIDKDAPLHLPTCPVALAQQALSQPDPLTTARAEAEALREALTTISIVEPGYEPSEDPCWGDTECKVCLKSRDIARAALAPAPAAAAGGEG